MAVELRITAPPPVVYAHRGAHGPDRPENSAAAVEHAIEIGVPGVEIDVCSLRDGTLVAAHDDWAPHDGRRVPLGELLLTDLCGISPGPLLHVDAALDLLRDTDTMLCLDWKGAGDVTLVGGLVRRHRLAARTIVSSTDPAAVAALKDAHPGLAVGLSLESWAGAATEIAGAVAASGADAAMLHHRLGAPEAIAALRARGKAAFLWTARDRETFESLWHRAPDGIMSDVVEELDRPAAAVGPDPGAAAPEKSSGTAAAP